jgi:putative intracellular protease/amidase
LHKREFAAHRNPREEHDGNVQFYPVNALAEAGAHVDTIANWHSNVIVDRELITGQQPMSAPAFGDILVEKLNSRMP